VRKSDDEEEELMISPANRLFATEGKNGKVAEN
jgi:hypothetical protein